MISSAMLEFKKIDQTKYLCTLDLETLYKSKDELKKFDGKWDEFLSSDITNPLVLTRKKNIISYPHKSWVPKKDNGKPSILITGGNPAPHSVLKDVYYAYEGKGTEHRFWKVFRELGYIDLVGTDKNIKEKFINLEYNSPFRFAFEAMFTFPSAASHPKWGGVIGLERLFGRRYLLQILESEKQRTKKLLSKFMPNTGSIIAMQKDAYNSLSQNIYNVNLAVQGKLTSNFGNVKVYGTPPTRWLYTKKMKKVLSDIKDKILLDK